MTRTALALGMLLFAAPDLPAQSAMEQQIWEQADDAVLLYMKLSVPAIAEGYNLGYARFYDWYVNTHLPELDDEPAISKVFAFAFEQAVKLGGQRFLPGPVGKLALGVLEAAHKRLNTSENAALPPHRYQAKVQAQLAEDRATIVGVADWFEQEQPTLFEEAMTEYLREELETPGIHAASDSRIAEGTRRKLHGFGFPEPSKESVKEIAERLLTPMIFATKRRSRPGLDDEFVRIDAQIAARRLLYPDDPERYCQDAFQLGMQAPDDCR